MSTTRKFRKQLRLGMPVHSLNGEAGKLSRVITDPENHQPTYLVVKAGRWRRSKEVVIPLSLVSSVSADQVNLDVTREALHDFPLYEVTLQQGSYEKPVPVGTVQLGGIYTSLTNRAYLTVKQRSIPDRSLAVEKGMVIRDAAGLRAGEVEGVILDQERRQGKYIVFRRDHFAPLQLIPVDLVHDVSSSAVKLRIGWEHIEKLPEYSSQTLQSWST